MLSEFLVKIANKPENIQKKKTKIIILNLSLTRLF